MIYQAGGFSLAWMVFYPWIMSLTGSTVSSDPAPVRVAVVAQESPLRMPSPTNNETAFIARPGRKKRSTIHAEPVISVIPPTAPLSPVLSQGSVVPPVFVGPVASHVAASVRDKSWIDQDDASSTGGWEVGGN